MEYYSTNQLDIEGILIYTCSVHLSQALHSHIGKPVYLCSGVLSLKIFY